MVVPAAHYPDSLLCARLLCIREGVFGLAFGIFEYCPFPKPVSMQTNSSWADFRGFWAIILLTLKVQVLVLSAR